MEIKYTIQGLLIYTAIAAYLLAFVTTLLRRPRMGYLLYIIGFVISVLSYAYRWYDVHHVPLQNLFEVFLFLGVFSYPVSWFCNRFLRIASQCADMLIAAVVLVPAGFVFSARAQQLPPILQSWLFAPHVAAYMLSYIIMAKATIHASAQLIGIPYKSNVNFISDEQATYRLVCVGFPLLTLGLVLGSCWGKLAWGDYWGWDPKELWSLASWLVYVGYLHFRYISGKKYCRINSAWVIVGMLTIVMTLLWVNLSKLFAGLHSYAF